MRLNWLRCLRNSSGWGIWPRRWMQLRTQPSRIAARTCGDRRWDARREPKRWLNAVRGVSTPALRQASERLPLTDREREIVMLLGEGLSSPAIAERLTLSARTVEGHIYRAMAKTGTSSRDELAALLPRHKPRSHQ